MIAVTRGLPSNWLGLRCSMPLRRVVMSRLGERPFDVDVWSAKARLYPQRNICEKNALFTPQMYDVEELSRLGAAIDRCLATGQDFTFVDVGANVGLYSLFVASRTGSRGRVLALEPQPGILERLRFNVQANPGYRIEIVPCAVGGHDGEVELAIDDRDRGGTMVVRDRADQEIGSQTIIRVRCRPLAAILAEAKITAIDAMKIDIEGSEDLALLPFLRDAAPELLPHLILMEDQPWRWSSDLRGPLQERGYTVAARTRHNVVLVRPA
jgi:FkbM family methyltransferase